jgi:hypothetical protein
MSTSFSLLLRAIRVILHSEMRNSRHREMELTQDVKIMKQSHKMATSFLLKSV